MPSPASAAVSCSFPCSPSPSTSTSATPPNGEHESYQLTHIPAGFATMFAAGTLSGLLGIGCGAVKVLAMDRIMRIPFKV